MHCIVSLAACSNHLRGVLEAGLCHFSAGDHSCYFVGAGAIVEHADLGFGATVIFALFDGEVLIGEGGDLRKVGYAENLLAAAERF
jgi:hypothetical protein